MKHPSVHEGGDVYFECKIRANPAVTEIGWKFEGQMLYPDKHQGKRIGRQPSEEQDWLRLWEQILQFFFSLSLVDWRYSFGNVSLLTLNSCGDGGQ